MPSTIQDAWLKSEQFYRDIFRNRKGDTYMAVRGKNSRNGIYTHDGQPGTGKTKSLAKIIKETENDEVPPTVAFFTANHNHLNKFKDDLLEEGIKDDEIIHGKGFGKVCLRLPRNDDVDSWTDDQKLVHAIYSTVKIRLGEILCGNCPHRKECEYYRFKCYRDKYRITLQPLEFLSTNYNDDKDIFVVDEAVTKEQKIFWYYASRKFTEFIENIEKISKGEYGLRDYQKAFFDFHRMILSKVSIIFNESPDILFAFCLKEESTTFQDRKDFLCDYENRYITHPGIIKNGYLDKQDSTYGILELFKSDGNRPLRGLSFINHANEQIRNAIKKEERETLLELVKNYIPLRQNLEFFNILIQESLIKKCAFLVHEKLEFITDINKIKECLEPIRENDSYQWGFIDDFPCLFDKRKNCAIISKMGKSYSGVEKSSTKVENVWFSIGFPYLYWVFDKSRDKPVITLDATYNHVIFQKLFSS